MTHLSCSSRSKSLLALVIVVSVIAVFMTAMVAESATRATGPTQPTPPSQGGIPPGQPFQNLLNLINQLKDLVNNNLISDHHAELTFTLDPGQTFSFPLPKKQSPIRIEVTVSRTNGGTQTPTEIRYAVVNQDPVSNEMTWIGTNSDGTVVATNTIDSTDDVIAVICGDSTCATHDDILLVDDLTKSTVKITSNADAVTVKSSYVVHLWF